MVRMKIFNAGIEPTFIQNIAAFDSIVVKIDILLYFLQEVTEINGVIGYFM